MKCVNCQFNNMPGSQTCARCGSSLTLATQSLDVNPPRAGSMSLLLRRVLPFHQLYFALRDRSGPRAGRAAPQLDTHLPPSALLRRLVIPGWAQLHLGERWQGRFLLGAWLALLVVGLLHFGTAIGSIILGLSFSVHSFSASDIVNRASDDRSVRAQLSRSILISLLLALVLYGPGAYLLTRVADPVNPAYTTGTFTSGDTLLMNHWATPGAGSVVLYDIPAYQRVPMRQPGQQRVGYSGQRVDRILAVAGESVELRKGVLLVNGKAGRHAALGHLRPLDSPLTTVPAGHVLILPTTARDLDFADNEGLLLEMSLVPAGRVRGVVYARLQPLHRFRLIF